MSLLSFNYKNLPVERQRTPIVGEEIVCSRAGRRIRSIPMPNLMHITIEPLIALIAGILILIQPRLLNYIVAIYLIIVGVLGLMHHA
jgi:threonine/homoserine efflux transporter RhtA